MGERRLATSMMLCIGLASTTLLPGLCLAQNGFDPEAGASRDVAGCTELAALHKLPESAIVACDKGDSIEVTMPLGPDPQGYAREKTVRGAYEFREYQVLQADLQEHAFDNLMRLLPIAGFTIKYFSSPSTITGRKQNTWILVNVGGEYYDVKVVHANEDPWNPAKDAQGISLEMETHHRVAVYGIEFSPDSQAINEKDSIILGEVLKYLRANPSLNVIVESHKFTTAGNSEEDLEITRKRADIVVAWLVAHGIAAGRLQAKARGRTKPITENDTAIEIQRNERIEFAKPSS